MLLKTIALNDKKFGDKLKKVIKTKKFQKRLTKYRQTISNPLQLSKKVFNVVLDPEGVDLREEERRKKAALLQQPV